MRVWLKERAKVSPRATRVLGNLAAFVVALFVIWLVWMVASLAEENISQNAALDQANERLVELGEEPVETPEPQAPIVQPPAQVSTDRIERAVAQYLATNPPDDGVDGRPGTDGTDAPSTAQVVQQVTPAVREAVVDYIAANPSADGQDGDDGSPGGDGAPGPSPSDEQVAAAVAAYCDSHDGCRGPAGADSTVPGPQGPEGPAGPAAYPFTFVFQLPDTGPLKGNTYRCVVENPDTVATCVEQQ